MDKRGKKISIGDDYCFISEIPIPVLDEMFYRLPIKDVMRCKSVCPDWKKLLSNPNFSKNYAKNSPYTALLHYYNPVPDHDSSLVPRMHLLEICDENGDYERSLIRELLPYCLLDSFTYVGSCNGFLCMQLCIEDRVFIYVNNPIWGGTIELPELCRADPHYCPNERYEFGFSPATNKFKVLRMVSILGSDIVDCEIFTVGVDRCWRPLPTSLTKLHFDCNCTTLNGFFYWISIVWTSTVGGPDLISSFDLAEEKFGQISLPPSLLLDPGVLELGVFGDQLVLICFVVESQQISIYKLNINSVVESWTRVVISSSWFPSRVYIHSPVPVAELQNGVMLFLYGDSLISCNVEQKRCSEINLEGVRNPANYFIPSPSFFSPSFSSHAEHIVESEHCVLLSADVIMEKKAP